MNSAIDLLANFPHYEEEEEAEDEDGKFTCRICGRTEYRNGEFGTIKLADIFPHVSEYPRRSSTEGRGNFSEKLCGNCASKEKIKEIKGSSPVPRMSSNNNNIPINNLTDHLTPNFVPRVHQVNNVSVLTLNEGNIPDKNLGVKSELDEVAMRNFSSGSDQFILRVGGDGNGMIYNEEKANHFHQNVIVSTREENQSGSIPSTVSNLESSPAPNVKRSPPKKGKKSPEVPHIDVKTGGNGPNSCPTCNKTFKSPKIAQRHFKRVHEKQNSYCCEICGAFFSYRGSLDSHLASHNPPEETIDCRVCGQKFKERSNLASHVKTNHFENTKKFKCEFCPSEFTKRVNLRHHQKRKHAAELENNNTGIPPSSSQNEKTEMSATTAAVSSADEKGAGGFKCEHCGRNFLFKNNLKAHLRTHTRDKKYTCEQCEKSFIYKESLKNHMLLHSNILPYQCDICGKKFRDRSNRRKHVKNVHKYLLINGEATTTIIPSPLTSAVPGGDKKNKGKKTNEENQTEESPNKKKGKKKKEETETGSSQSVPKKKANKKKEAAGQSVIVSNSNLPPNSNLHSNSNLTTNPNLNSSGSDRVKIIMSPKSEIISDSRLIGVADADYGQMYTGRNVIVKTPISLPPPDSDFYSHPNIPMQQQQNVIVYPKNNKEFGQSVISSIEDQHQQQQQQQHQQYYDYHHHHQQQQQQQDMKYLPLPVSNLDVSSPDRFEYQQNSNSNSNEVLGYGDEGQRYLTSEPNPSVYAPQEDGQFWVNTTYPTAGQSAYEGQHGGQAIQMTNVPYGQQQPPTEQDSTGNIYKDLQQFDFSFL